MALRHTVPDVGTESLTFNQASRKSCFNKWVYWSGWTLHDSVFAVQLKRLVSACCCAQKLTKSATFRAYQAAR